MFLYPTFPDTQYVLSAAALGQSNFCGVASKIITIKPVMKNSFSFYNLQLARSIWRYKTDPATLKTYKEIIYLLNLIKYIKQQF